ncbi:MAG: tetratricopeptide repeat protein, partial [Sulfurovum sp.]|nr:tetratricopeptide repeat protein [Sulfurovum sp.]
SGQSKRARVISHHHLAQYIDRGETPHIVKLHGDAHLHPFNDKENTQEIDKSLADSVQTLLANTKLIVIGYGGGDKSIAKLLESVSRQGMVYWCNKETPEKTELEEWWNSLPYKQHVEEFDFDKIMNAFGDKFKLEAPDFNKFATQLKSQYDESFKKETQEAIENNDIDELQKLISQSLRSGKYEKGLESALEAKKLIEGEEDNAEMLVDINNDIGGFYIHLAKYDKAIELLEETLTIELGENHPLTATSYNNIGSAWDSKGEYDKAIEYYEKALKITCATLEENHPFTATSYNNIGLAWDSKGEYDEAMKYHEKALKIRLATLGENHPLTATSYNNIGSVWNSKGEYDKAIEYYEKALKITCA